MKENGDLGLALFLLHARGEKVELHLSPPRFPCLSEVSTEQVQLFGRL
jgi:hypothetical protein